MGAVSGAVPDAAGGRDTGERGRSYRFGGRLDAARHGFRFGDHHGDPYSTRPLPAGAYARSAGAGPGLYV
jgi:hypothetical protein